MADRGRPRQTVEKEGLDKKKHVKDPHFFSRFPPFREKSTKNELIKIIKTGKIYEKFSHFVK